MPRHIESAIQKNCVTWFRLQYPSIGRLLFAVPNGGARNAKEAAIMKGEGVTAGVSDLILLYGSGNYNALCIEFKTQDKSSKQSPLQKEWQALTEQYGNKYVICRSFDDFQQEVQKYLFLQTAENRLGEFPGNRCQFPTPREWNESEFDAARKVIFMHLGKEQVIKYTKEFAKMLAIAESEDLKALKESIAQAIGSTLNQKQ